MNPGDEIHAAKLVDAFLRDHPEYQHRRAELLAHANKIGMLRRTKPNKKKKRRKK